MKWVKMLKDWPATVRKHPDLVKERIRKGIPDSLRADVWWALTGAAQKQAAAPDLYRKLLSTPIAPEDDLQIRKDLPREYQNHIMYRSPVSGSRHIFSKGQMSLYNVLHAYSLYNPKVGYVQGQASIAGLCLMYLPEEQSFWMMERLLDGPYRLKGLYEHSMPLAHHFVGVFDRLLRHFSPSLSKHLDVECVLPTSYAFRWLTMRFAEFPKPLVVRIFDIFLHQGMKIVYRVALYLMLSREARLMAMGMEDIMMELQQLPQDPAMWRADEVISGALDVKLTGALIDKCAAAYESEQAMRHMKQRKGK